MLDPSLNLTCLNAITETLVCRLDPQRFRQHEFEL